ncbi:hypothetical protein M0813_11988 [Anaeramoeba flamelloides]|uniref:Uncharacterized protein n=1 Tax=Anaeramoeba flamelloides TaxID=1746091 RepID=A0ABQ8ZDT8_9EUKA|nr:hypothetical protein M0813_11988 [Anaeramoeba flamelloides]
MKKTNRESEFRKLNVTMKEKEKEEEDNKKKNVIYDQNERKINENIIIDKNQDNQKKSLSWIPSYFKDRDYGSSINELNKPITVNSLQLDDNIGNQYYSKTDGYPSIDLVTMWVNGSDPIFQKEMINELEKFKNCKQNCRYANKENWCCPSTEKKEISKRYFDLGELKYLLRSVDQFAPWIRKIFIVTNNQIPNWLNLSNKRIQIVTPSEFVKYPEDLPTFSSPALESQLHLIQGLSRFFIYSCDDFFLMTKIWPSDFLTLDNIYQLRTDWTLPMTDYKHFLKNEKNSIDQRQDVYGESLRFTDTIFDLTFGYKIRHVGSHTPILIDKYILERIWKEWPKEMEQTAKSKFRLGSQMHFQTTVSNYINEAWIKNEFCKYLYINFDRNNDKTFNYDEIKEISIAISEENGFDQKQILKSLIDKIDQEILPKKFASNNLQIDCQILKKHSLISTYLSGLNDPHLKLFKSQNCKKDYIFISSSDFPDLRRAFKKIDYLNCKFVCFNNDFTYKALEDKQQIIDKFADFANQKWSLPSQFELPENKSNSFLRI